MPRHVASFFARHTTGNQRFDLLVKMLPNLYVTHLLLMKTSSTIHDEAPRRDRPSSLYVPESTLPQSLQRPAAKLRR